ncbi:MAG TPA: hypothetical protein VGK16_02890 [Candidatus Limnocylindrales bacterium]|jgi:hypothetical protein
MQTLETGPDLAPGSPLRLITDGPAAGIEPDDPGDLMLTCKLICRCGSFLSCSDSC